MVGWIRTLVVLFPVFVCGVSTVAAEETSAKIDRWIGALADDSYSVRQEAANQLLGIGAPARGALSEVIDRPDPELRAAARRLLVLIDRSEFERRLEAFAADTDGKHGLTLPGWEAYRDLIGDDAASRDLFIEMQRHEGALLEKIFGEDPQTVQWEDRLVKLPPWQIATRTGVAMRPVGSCAAMLLLGSVPEGRVSDRGVMHLVHMLQQPPLRESLQPGAGAHSEPLRRLLVGWLTHCPNRNEQVLTQRLGVASLYELREGLPLALAVAHSEPAYLTVQPTTRAMAVLVAAQLGGPEHVPQLEPLLDDDTVCLRARVGHAVNADNPMTVATIEIRDVALVGLLQLTGQNPAQYGFANAVRQQPNRLYNLGTLYLANDRQRQAALEKWRQWKSRESRVEAGNRPAGGGSKASS